VSDSAAQQPKDLLFLRPIAQGMIVSEVSNMVIVIFRSRVRPDADLTGIDALAARMYEIASSMPGFVSYKEFHADDQETVAVVEFDSQEHLLAWRGHPEHLAAQQRGRDSVFEIYDIAVCEQVRRYGFTKERGRFETQ
jgi:heme-degrading monooxygenase HmoA